MRNISQFVFFVKSKHRNSEIIPPRLHPFLGKLNDFDLKYGNQKENAKTNISGRKYQDWGANSPATRISKNTPIESRDVLGIEDYWKSGIPIQ
jgi:hypothetical protein